MDKVARMPAEDRRDVFTEAAARFGIRPAIIEKDFWVCAALKLLFGKSRFAKSLVLKGGTSLSKVHGLIERFSEDIDLVLDWKLIGFGKGLRDPMQDFDSKSKQDQFNKEINRMAAAYIAATLCPEVDDLVRKEDIGLSATVDRDDPYAVNMRYPALRRPISARKSALKSGPSPPGSLPPGMRSGPTPPMPCRGFSRTRTVKSWRSRRSGPSGRKRRFFIRRHTGRQ